MRSWKMARYRLEQQADGAYLGSISSNDGTFSQEIKKPVEPSWKMSSAILSEVQACDRT